MPSAPALRALVLAFVGLMFSTGSVLLYTFSFTSPSLAERFGWSATETFAAVSLVQLGTAAGALLVGAVLRTAPAFKVVPASAALLGAGLLLLSSTGSSAFAYLLFFLLPLAGGAAAPLGYSKIVVGQFDRHRGLALGLALSGVAVAAALFPLTLGPLALAHGFAAVYRTCGFILLGLAPVLFVLLPRDAASAQPNHRACPNGPIPFWALALVFALLGAVSVALLTHFVAITGRIGLAPATAVRVAAVIGVTAIAGRVLVGAALDRIDARQVLAAVLVITATVCLALWLGRGQIAAIAAAALLGLVLGAEIDLLSYLLSRYAPPASFAPLFGRLFALFTLATALGPLAAASLSGRMDGYGPALAVGGVMCLLSLPLVWRLPHPGRKDASA